MFPLFSIFTLLRPSVAGADVSVPDSTSWQHLGEVEVTAPVTAPRIDDSGAMVIGTGAIRHSMSVLGESDVTRFIKMMPGVSAGGDYASGLSIDGADYSQTLYTIGGAPVFFPYHFGGIFSTFNTSHFSKVRLERSIHDSSFPNRLGGLVALDTPSVAAEEVGGTVNAGMLASSATVRVPVMAGLSVTASGRVSYIDALYGWLLRTDDTNTRYNLYDLNLTVEYHPASRDRITASGFLNRDRLTFKDDNYALDTRIRWGNNVASLSWEHTGKVRMAHTLYYSSMSNQLDLVMPQLTVDVPSSIMQGGVHGGFAVNLPKKFAPMKWGYAVELTSATPQSATVTGFGEGAVAIERVPPAVESRLWAESGYDLARDITIRAGLKATWWANRGYNSVAVDPQVTVMYRRAANTFSLQGAVFHQYLHQVGFSDIGMASNFWIASEADIPPQRSLSVSLSYTRRLGDGVADITAGAYYKRVYNQSEYDGFILNLLQRDYRATDYISMGEGYNAGGEVMVRKNSGHLTGHAGYSYAIGRRHFPGMTDGYVTAANEIRHSVSVAASYRFDRHWSCTAAFDYSSGRPVTPVTAMYFIGESLIMTKGKRNSSRLPAYHRLDVGGNYRFTTGGKHKLVHNLSVSVVNAYGHRNVEISSFIFDPDSGSYLRKDVSSIYRFLPSLSYSIDF
ncbi:MAG: hypothetical protein NC117_09615 [Pseudoflavonifractor sp.]|nr:hypothetical protein [Pseudoflavonifractor sp.]